MTLDEATLEVRGSETRLERVPIAANLRHDQLDDVVTEASLTGEAPADYAFARRAGVRLPPGAAPEGRSARSCAASPRTSTGPTTTSGSTARRRATTASPTATRRCAISDAPARRAAGPDRGRGDDPGQQHLGRLARRAAACPASTAARPAWRRASRCAWAPRPAPHAGMGVAQYAWATSPLRRYVDLVNQWQIIACARHGRTAALAAPFKPKDAALFSIISAFDAAYARLQRLPAGHRALLDAALAAAERRRRARRRRDEGRPGARRRRCRWCSGRPAPRACRAAARVRVRITGIDLLTLDVHASAARAAGRRGAARPTRRRRPKSGDDEADASRRR